MYARYFGKGFLPVASTTSGLAGSFRAAFRRIFERELRESGGLDGMRLDIAADMAASGVTYAYRDWFAMTFSS